MTADAYSRNAVRSSIRAFLIGKMCSGLFSILNLLLLVRVLDGVEYGHYVALIAAAEVTFSLSSCGLPWASARFIPEYRLHASRGALSAFAVRLLACQLGILSLAVIVVANWCEEFLAWTRIPLSDGATATWLMLIVIEGSSRFCSDGLLGPLLRQKAASLSVVVRQGLFLVLLIVSAVTSESSLDFVLAAEAGAASAGLIVAGLAVWRHLATLDASESAADWVAPEGRKVVFTAINMYAGSLFYFFYSPQVFIIFLQRYLGSDSTAMFGFIRNIYEQMARYLPATLLFSVIRPKLIASYVGPGGTKSLLSGATLAGKVSLFCLLPVVGLLMSRGEGVVALMSGGRFADTGLLLFAFTLILVPFSQRHLIETVVVAMGYSAVCMGASAIGVLGLPVALWGLEQGAGLWAGVLALGLGHTMFVIVLTLFLKRTVGYEGGVGGYIKLGVATILAGGISALLPSLPWRGIDVLSAGLVASVAFLVGARALRPFTVAEREAVNAFIGKPWFVW